jgi:hypothetical protein
VSTGQYKTKGRVTRTSLKIGVNAGHLDIIPKTSVGIVISIIVIWTPYHKASVESVINIIVTCDLFILSLHLKQELHTIPVNLNSPPIL